MFDQLLRFAPIYQTRVWGGRRLETLLHRVLPDAQPYGESWDLVDREKEQSVVVDGEQAGMSLHELWTQHREAVFGTKYAAHPSLRFPVLIKVLDCTDKLSIQVHPPARVAAELKGEPKTEMWFVADADADAQIYAGLRAEVTREQFEQAITAGTVAECVHEVHPRAGDSMFLPSGRLHALGSGLLIYEIQQNSDTTYRVFDWNRVGLDGKPRELHVEQSLKCIDFDDVEPALEHSEKVIAQCEHFTVTRARTGFPSKGNDVRIAMAIQPTRWGDAQLQPGDVALKPASAQLPEPVGEWLEIEM